MTDKSAVEGNNDHNFSKEHQQHQPKQQEQQQQLEYPSSSLSKEQRKLEGKQRKRQHIEASGGVRPRNSTRKESQSSQKNNHNNDDGKQHCGKSNSRRSNSTRHVVGGPSLATRPKRSFQPNPNADRRVDGSHYQNNNSYDYNNIHSNIQRSSFTVIPHRFGRVMEHTPCRNKSRFSTLSIALPTSVLTNCQTKELRTLLVGQIARAATIYHVDEIVIFSDELINKSNDNNNNNGYHGGSSWRDYKRRKFSKEDGSSTTNSTKENDAKNDNDENHDDKNTITTTVPKTSSTPQEFMARLLQYCECPQYLRRSFFPMHPDLQFAGILAPVDAPHHVRAQDKSKYREGVVLNKTSSRGNSLVNCGIPNRHVEIDRTIAPGLRCTVKIDPSLYGKPGPIRGVVVSPAAPRDDNGTYWGYTTRMADSIGQALDGCPYEGGTYDLKIGTSERGDRSVDDKNFTLPQYGHAMIVFGGVAGIEECVDADESLKVGGTQSKSLFDMWLNTCPYQGSRTIRTEEAVMISLARLSPGLHKSARSKPLQENELQEKGDNEVVFSDDSPSDETSSSSSSYSEEEDQMENKK